MNVLMELSISKVILSFKDNNRGMPEVVGNLN
jgi:hypothetical protein